VIPSLRDWHNTYQEQGLVIIGNHYPEFTHEKEIENLKAAVKELNINYPVAQDNQGVTWRAYNNRYWPTLYLIDKQGNIRYLHIGEGAYRETEAAIQTLLDETYP
jgi:alkyl hydroperoxide reductase subunit AhpC